MDYMAVVQPMGHSDRPTPPLDDCSLVTVGAREDVISCKDSQPITPSESSVAARKDSADWQNTLKKEQTST